MALAPLSLVILTFLVLCYNAGCYGKSDNGAEPADDSLAGLTDREVITTLVKRLEELELWKKRQEIETGRLHSTVLEQKGKIEVLERLLTEHSETDPGTRQGIHDEATGGQHVTGLGETQEKPGVVDGRIRRNGRETLGQGQDRVHTKRQIDEVNRVAFFAMTTDHLTNLGPGQILEFDNVTTNIGHAYSPHTGAFTAPFGGTYVFSVSLMGHERRPTHYYVAKNGAELSRLYIHGSESPFTTSSHTVVLQLRQGDDIEIRNSDAGEGVNGSRYSCFSGFLLYFDEMSSQIIG